MNDESSFSIIDFGSSKIRLGLFNSYLENSNFIIEDNLITNFKDRIIEDHSAKKVIKKLILRSEKETNQHIENVNIMIDDPKGLMVNLSLKKKIENNLNETNIKKIIQEGKILIEDNYKNFKVCHLIISQYKVDGTKYDKIPNDLFINDIIVDIKFLLISRDLINNFRYYFKSNHISVNNFYNTSYVKTLGYNKYFENFDFKFFLDLGYKKTSLSIYKENKLDQIHYIPIGSLHITKDISKVTKVSIEDAENLKKNLKQTNIDLNNHHEDLLIKVIHARIEEIIDLCFKNLNNFKEYRSSNSILIFIGEGSKLLNKNTIYLKEEYNFFNEMNFFEENSETICNSAYNFHFSENINEVKFTPKKHRKYGFFERFFYMFNI